MRNKRIATFAWIFFGLITTSVITAIIFDLSNRVGEKEYSLGEISYILVPLSFAFVGALIISRQPRNVIGMLMMLPGISLTVVVDAYLGPFINGVSPIPASPTPIFLFILWFSNWNWLLLIFPLMFIMVLFPTGHPLNPRWGWLIHLGLGIVAVFILLITFSRSLAPGSGGVDWAFPNPIGFLDPAFIDVVLAPFLVAFPVWIVLCAVSLFVRFRHSRGIEREQIKWLFYAGAIFTVFYISTFVGASYSQAESVWIFLLWLGMLTFPAAIAIAILRYRLWDVDVIIRRTLQYSALTATLGLLYFGSVVILEQLLRSLTGQAEQSQTVIVISTLGIAALFSPLRRRIQEIIDRRFYRRRYNAEHTLQALAETLRDEVDLEHMSQDILEAVQGSMQPEKVILWIREPRANRQTQPEATWQFSAINRSKQ